MEPHGFGKAVRFAVIMEVFYPSKGVGARFARKETDGLVTMLL